MLKDILAVFVLPAIDIFLKAAQPNVFTSLIPRKLRFVLELQARQHLLVVLLDIFNDRLDFGLELVFPRHCTYNNKCH